MAEMVWLRIDHGAVYWCPSPKPAQYTFSLETMDFSGIHSVVFPVLNWILQQMIRQIRPALTLFAVFVVLTGALYPLAVTGIARVIFPVRAGGSLLEENDIPVGSALIGQYFTDPGYFWGRPSTTPGAPYLIFDPVGLTGSSGSNLGPLSQELVDIVQERVQALLTADPGNTLPIPVDLVTASASGLDPHISVSAAMYQVARVARIRNLSQADLLALVDQYTENRTLGFLGEPRVNILRINLALDEIK
jgi:K+-transporting ATPase ATPase C chain